jgi:hypothetical protein
MLFYGTKQDAYNKYSYLKSETDSSLQNVVLNKNKIMNNIQKVSHFLFSVVYIFMFQMT